MNDGGGGGDSPGVRGFAQEVCWYTLDTLGPTRRKLRHRNLVQYGIRTI